MLFQPSTSSYGWVRPHYAAQVMLSQQAREGSYGADSGGGVNPDVAASIIGGALSLGTAVVGGVISGKQAKKAREHESDMAHQAMMASLMAPPAPASSSPFGTGTVLLVLGGLSVVGLGGLYVATRPSPTAAKTNPLPLLIPIIMGGVALAGTIGGSIAAGKQAKKKRESDEKMAKTRAKQEQAMLEQAQQAQLEIARVQAEQEAIAAAAATKLYTTISVVGGVVVLGIGGFLLMRSS